MSSRLSAPIAPASAAGETPFHDLARYVAIPRVSALRLSPSRAGRARSASSRQRSVGSLLIRHQGPVPVWRRVALAGDGHVIAG